MGKTRGVDLKRVAYRQHGMITRQQALTELTLSALRWKLDRGLWQVVHPGVYCTHNGNYDWWGRASATLLRCGDGAALALDSAAYVLGINDFQPPILQIDVPHPQKRVRLSRTLIRRRRRLRTIQRKGLTVTAAEVTVLDLGDEPVAFREDAIGVAARAVQRRKVAATALADELAARRTHQYRRALELSLGIVAEGAESVLEVAFMTKVVRAHGLPPMRLAVPEGAVGHSIRRDAVNDAYRVIVELDGRLGHEGRRGVDIRRDRRAAAQGYLTIRGDWVDVDSDPCGMALDLDGTYRSRGYRGTLLSCTPGCPATQQRLRSG